MHCLMLSELRFGVKKYNLCDYKISHFMKTCFYNTFPIMVQYAINYIPGHEI